MNITEVRSRVMVAVLELSAVMQTTITPSKSRDTLRLEKKYKHRMARTLWVNVAFLPSGPVDRALISAKRDVLAGYGIGFDSGASCDGEVHWEIDWSLRLIDEAEQADLAVATDAVDEIAAGMQIE